MNTSVQTISPDDTGFEKGIPEYIIPDHIPPIISNDSNSIESLYNETDTTNNESSEIETPKFPVAPLLSKPLEGKFQLLQLWEGVVQKIDDKEFEATIKDKTNHELNDEMVVLDIEEISPSDRNIAKPGAVFYWSIGYADYPGRGRIRESKIRFRRLPGWDNREIENAKATGEKLAKLFSTDSINPS